MGRAEAAAPGERPAERPSESVYDLGEPGSGNRQYATSVRPARTTRIDSRTPDGRPGRNLAASLRWISASPSRFGQGLTRPIAGMRCGKYRANTCRGNNVDFVDEGSENASHGDDPVSSRT